MRDLRFRLCVLGRQAGPGRVRWVLCHSCSSSYFFPSPILPLPLQPSEEEGFTREAFFVRNVALTLVLKFGETHSLRVGFLIFLPLLLPPNLIFANEGGRERRRKR